MGLILAAIVLVAAIEAGSRQPLQGDVRQSDTAATEAYQEQRGPAEGYWWPEFAARDTYAQWAMAVLALIGAATGILGVIWIRQTLLATRDTANAAIDAGKTAKLALDADQRPWLSLGYLNIEKVEIQNGRLLVTIEIDAENLGRSPAVQVDTAFTTTFSLDSSPFRTPNETTMVDVKSIRVGHRRFIAAMS